MTFIEQRERLKKPERLAAGEIELVSEEVATSSDGYTYFLRNVKVGDESDPDIRRSFHERANQYEQMLRNHPEWPAPYLDESGELVVDPHNLAARDLYYDEFGQATLMTEWATHLKKATALEPLQRLAQGGMFFPGGRLDRRTLELFTNMPDGIGLRSRQHIYAQLLVDRAAQSDARQLEIISLGSGASVPNIQATKAIESEVGKGVNWHLYDIDQQALQSAQQLVGEMDAQQSTFDFGPTRADAQQGESPFLGRSYLEGRQLDNESLDAIDALGLWEYLTDKQASTFLKTLYPKLKPGAPMIVSNMLPSRPHPEYNRRAVGWPDLYMRSVDDLIRIVKSAGINTEMVTVTLPDDGVYAVMEITKT